MARMPLDCWQHGPWDCAHVTERRLEAREEGRGSPGKDCPASARAALSVGAWERHTRNHNSSRYHPTCYSVRSAESGSGSRRAGSAMPSGCGSPGCPTQPVTSNRGRR